MKKRIVILSWFLAVCGFVFAQKTYNMEIRMNDGSVKSYPMHQVIRVVHDSHRTIIYIKTKETHTIQVFKDTDVASIEWKQSKAAEANAAESHQSL